MAGELRRAHVSRTLAAGVGRGNELIMPNIENQALEVVRVQYTCEGAIDDEIVLGLTHQKDALDTTFTSQLEADARVWHHHLYSIGDPGDYVEDLRGYGILLAGSQRFIGFNSTGATLVIGVRLWYITRQIGDQEWANLAKTTSFEA